MTFDAEEVLLADFSSFRDFHEADSSWKIAAFSLVDAHDGVRGTPLKGLDCF